MSSNRDQTAAPGTTRAVAAAHAAWGAALVCFPGPLLRAAAGWPGSPAERRVMRLLGGRHLCQAAITAARPAPAVLAAGGAADLLHAASGVALACGRARWRRAAALSAAGAAGFAAADFAVAAAGRGFHLRAGRRHRKLA